MSYALRNTLILFVLLVAVIAAGAYRMVNHNAERNTLEQRQQSLNSELEEVSQVLAHFDTVMAQISTLEQEWEERRDHGIPAEESPNLTLAFLDELAQRTRRDINFDITHRGRTDTEVYSFNTFVVDGRGDFRALYPFIWMLEHGRRPYAVNRLQVQFSGRDNWVDFVLVLRAFQSDKAARLAARPLAAASESSDSSDSPPALARNMFSPLITQTLPPNVDGLPEVEGARLTALTHDTAFVQDRRGETHRLRVGDRVYLGSLRTIDVMDNRAVFLLNKGGIWRWVTLRIEEGEGRR